MDKTTFVEREHRIQSFSMQAQQIPVKVVHVFNKTAFPIDFIRAECAKIFLVRVFHLLVFLQVSFLSGGVSAEVAIESDALMNTPRVPQQGTLIRRTVVTLLARKPDALSATINIDFLVVKQGSENWGL